VTAEPQIGTVTRADWRLLLAAALATAASAVFHFVSTNRVLPFIITAISLAVLASLVGRSVDRLGDRLGSGATGFVQSALGNLPELFIGIFALRAGLVNVVQSALIGSILANLLLVLGLAFVAGGLRHGTQTFTAHAARMNMLLLVVAVGIVAIPTLAVHIGGPAAHHPRALSDVASIILLVIFALSIPASLKSGDQDTEGPRHDGPLWPISVVLVVLLASSVAAACVSDWFIAALTPALHVLHMSQAFAGLVIVAIAGNAVENFVGIKLAAANRTDYALSVILQSPVQIAVGLFPVLVLLSGVLGGAPLTLVMPTLLLAALAIGTTVGIVVVFDGESTWLEGAILVGLYVTIGAAFWWG
jgi:Ca2+:H+ antiporter